MALYAAATWTASVGRAKGKRERRVARQPGVALSILTYRFSIIVILSYIHEVAPCQPAMLLGEHFEQFIKAQLASGRYANGSEVVREALRLLEDREKLRAVRLEELRAAIKAGIDGSSSHVALPDIFPAHRGTRRARPVPDLPGSIRLVRWARPTFIRPHCKNVGHAHPTRLVTPVIDLASFGGFQKYLCLVRLTHSLKKV